MSFNLTNTANVSDTGTFALDGASGVATAVVGGITYLFVASQVDDGVSVFSVAANGTLTNVGNVFDVDNVSYELDGASEVTTAVLGGITYLFVAGSDDDGISVFSVAAGGALTSVDTVDDSENGTLELDRVSGLATAVVGGVTYLFASGFDDDGVSVFSVAGNGVLTQVFSVTDGGTFELDGAQGVSTAVVGGNTYLFVAGNVDSGVSVFSVAANGALSQVDFVDDSEDAALELAGAQEVATAVVGGVTYLFVSGGTDDGVSVFSVAATGVLTNVFNVTDAGVLELDGAFGLTTGVLDGTTYLFVSGTDDDGMSVFSVANGGALTNVANIPIPLNPNEGVTELDGAANLTAAVVGGVTHVFAAGSVDDGISAFALQSSGLTATMRWFFPLRTNFDGIAGTDVADLDGDGVLDPSPIDIADDFSNYNGATTETVRIEVVVTNPTGLDATELTVFLTEDGTNFTFSGVGPFTLPSAKSVTFTFDTIIDLQTNQFVVPLLEQFRISYKYGGVPQTLVFSDDITPQNPLLPGAADQTVVAADGLDLHGTVFNDANADSTFGLAEVGVANVEVKLYADTGSTAGVFDAGDLLLATTTTDVEGEYHFTGLARGDYIVQVTAANFTPGQALESLSVSSPGGVDPDDNVDNDDNGTPLAGNGVVSLPIRLDYNQEPLRLLGPNIERVSVDNAGAQVLAGGLDPSISGTGRYVAFNSSGLNLVAGQVDTNAGADVFVYDRDLGTARLASGIQGSTTATGNGASFDAAISASGNSVAFTSNSTNLVAGQTDTNAGSDIFVFDSVSGTTRLISGVQGSVTTTGNGASSQASIAPEGRFVAFSSLANNLVATDANGVSDVFLFDRTSGTTSLISLAHSNPQNVQGDGGSFNPSVSSNLFGRGVLVAFESDATNLLGSSGVDSNGFRDIFVRDTDIVLETTRVSVGVGNVQSNGDSFNASISFDARFVAFESDASNLVAGDITTGAGGFRDIFFAEINGSGNTIAIERVSVASDGTAANGASFNAQVSADGRYVTFQSDANNLVADDTNGVTDVFVHDIVTHTTRRLSVDEAGSQGTGGGSTNPTISADGRIVAFDSAAIDLVPSDSNGATDVFAVTSLAGADINTTLDFGFISNPPPVIANLGGDTVTFTEEGPAVLLDDSSLPEVAATVTDDQTSFNGGNLTVSITANEVGAEDVLGIATSATVGLTSGTNVGSEVAVDAGSGLVVIGTVTSNGTGGNDLVVTFNASAGPTNVGLLINALTYSNTNTTDPSTSPRTIAVSVNDGLGGTDSENVTVNITPINDEPTLVAAAVDPTFTEGDALPADVFMLPIVPSTIEAGQTFTGITLTITNVTDGANEVFHFNGTNFSLVDGNGPPGVTVSVVGTTATVSLSGASLSAAQLQTLIDGIGYSNLSESPTDADRLVTITQLVDSGLNTPPPNDSTTTLSIASTVNVDAVNDPPAFADLNATPTFTENGAAVVLDNNATVSDFELDVANNYNGATLTLVRSTGTNPDDVFNDGSGTLTFGATSVSLTGTGQVGTYTQVNGTLVITFDSNATSAAVDSVLQQLTYRNTNDNPTTPSVTIDYTFSDGNAGAQGTGATPGIATGSIVVGITAVNDPPVLDLDSSAAGSGFQVQFIPGPGGTPVTVADGDSSIVDVDDANIEQATITITNPQAGDVLSVLGPLLGGITVDPASTATNLILTGSATKAAYETALEQVRFNNPLAAPDQTTRVINITVSDGTDSSNTAIASIVLNQPPTTPVDTDATADAVTEGAAEGTLVGIDANSTDPDLNPIPIVYLLSANPSGFFSINSSTGVVSVSAAGATGVDFETSGGSYNITVQATDGDGASSTQNFTINVTNVPPTPPVDSNIGANTISEGAANGAAVAGFAASSSDPNGPAVSFSLTDTAGGRFAINASTGTLTVLNAALLNFEDNTSHQITVQASDGSGGTSTQNFTITVTNVAPVSTTDAYPLDEDNTLTVAAAAGVLTNDSDVHGGTITAVLDSGPANAASFALQSDGSFSYTPSANFSGVDSFTYHANDGTAAGNTVTVNLNVAAINDAPVLGGVPASRLLPADGTALNVAPALTVGDVDSSSLTSATVRVSAGSFVGANDVLAANTAGTSITAFYDPATETLTLSGSDTLAHYQQVLASVTFDTTDTNPGNSGLNPTRTIEWQLNDGSAANNLSSITATTINVSQPSSQDFNGDAVSDVLWRLNNGFVAEWLMSDGAIAQNLGVAQPDLAWHFQDTGDFGADGKSDILWRHDNGQAVLWQMDGATILSNQSVAVIGNDWHNEGVADFNGDGKADVLWHNDSGQVALWTMDGAQITNNQSVGNIDASWHVQGLLDTGGDGKSDVLLRNDSGQVVLWTMDGAQITNNQSVTNNLGLDWNIVGTGDFGGDGKGDVLLRNDSGQVVIWTMDGNQIVDNQSVATPGNEWQVQDVGDYNLDGKSDVLWRHDSGQVVLWEMNGNQIVSNHTVTYQGGTPAPIGLEWTVQNHHYDLL